jgi:hypothetical protein
MLDSVRGVLPDWPEWALDVLLVMTVLLITTLVFTSFYTSDDEESADNTSSSKDPVDAQQRGELHNKFDKFRKNYMAVYLVIMLADWM